MQHLDTSALDRIVAVSKVGDGVHVETHPAGAILEHGRWKSTGAAWPDG